MVMRWFAKEDLETFFKLLQGERQVDQVRLDYWLRFVGQIAYTRIILGGQAKLDRSTDFVEFREKNAQRIGFLQGGVAEDNAFLMQIGEYVIVEFSRTGNACFIRRQTGLPFNVGQRIFDLNLLKDKGSAVNRIVHSRRWQSECDQWLASVGIYPDRGTLSMGPQPASVASQGFSGWTSPPKLHVGEKTPLQIKSPAAKERNTEASIQEALRFADHWFMSAKVRDNRSEGGAFWLFLPQKNQEIEKKLLALGFRYNENRGGYWIK
jgi:hypothetical protein